MVRCYPNSIRTEFSEEMRAVYWEVSMDALDSSSWSMLGVFLKELFDWPLELLNGYVDTFKARSVLHDQDYQAIYRVGDTAMGRVLSMISQERSIDLSKRQGVIAALPPLLLGLGIMSSALIRTDVWYRLPVWQLYLSVAVVLLPGIAVGLGGLLALLKRIPDWGLTWVGCAFMGVTLFAKVLVEEGVEEGWLSLAPSTEMVLGLAILLAGFTFLIITARRGWTQAGLFTIAVACTMGLSLFQSLTAAPFNRDDIAIFAGPLGLIIASLIYVYIFQPGILRIVIILGVGLVNTGAAVIATNTWSSWFENKGAPSPLLPLLVILTVLLFSGPVSGLILRLINRLCGGKTPAN
jgi:hypothetical protein